MRKLNTILLILFLGMFQSLLAQRSYDVFDVKDYRNSVVVSIGNEQHSVRILSDYGQIVQQSNNTSMVGKYAFQAQEYETDLDLYLFPSRLYSPVQKRFIQPDPKSQYHSPYLFVGADPVNTVDWDGNEGKPLILYGEDDSNDILKNAVANFKAEVPDAYYYPLSAFINGELGDLTEWNGNSFLLSHMKLSKGSEILAERTSDPLNLRSNVRSRRTIAKASYNAENDVYDVGIDATKFGRELRNLSESRGIRLSNVFAGGCQGSIAAERIADGVTEIPSAGQRSWLTVAGLKENYFAAIERKATGGANAVSEFAIGDAKKMHVGSAEGSQLREMANGRVPSVHPEYFKIVSREF